MSGIDAIEIKECVLAREVSMIEVADVYNECMVACGFGIDSSPVVRGFGVGD